MFVERLQLIRELGGLNKVELARLCGFRHTYISFVEREEAGAEVGRSRLVTLALMLNISLDWLLLGRGKAPVEQAVRAAVERARSEPGAVRAEIDAVLGVQPKPVARRRVRPRGTARAKPLPRRPSMEARP